MGDEENSLSRDEELVALRAEVKALRSAAPVSVTLASLLNLLIGALYAIAKAFERMDPRHCGGQP